MDQVFSRHSTLLRKKNAETGVELVQLLKQSYTPTPEIKLLTEVADVKEWLSPCVDQAFAGLTEGYQFLIEQKDEDVYVRDKLFSVVESYREGAVLLKSKPTGKPQRAQRRHLFFSHPKKVENAALLSEEERESRTRELCRASENKAVECFNALKKNVKKLFAMSLLNAEQYNWWKDIIAHQESANWSAQGIKRITKRALSINDYWTVYFKALYLHICTPFKTID